MKRLNIGDVELAYLDCGSGLPVILVHGFPLDHTMWNAQIDAFAEHHRLIVPDLRGFGKSGVTEGAVAMEQLADDLAVLLDGIGVNEPVVLCGLSMGGYVAFAFARKYASRLRGLILCDTRSAADTPDKADSRRAMAARVLHDGVASLVEQMMPSLFAKGAMETRAKTIESLRAAMLDGDPRGMAAAAIGMADRPDMTATLTEIDCPAMVICGNQDAFTPPEEMRSISQAIPHCEFVEIDGSGHMTPVESPDEFNAAVLRFLEKKLRVES